MSIRKKNDTIIIIQCTIRARFVVKPEGVNTIFLTTPDGVHCNLGVEEPRGGVEPQTPDKLSTVYHVSIIGFQG